MQTLARNRQTVWYALLTSKTELTDEYGNKTGQYELSYSDPVKTAMNVRWDTGAVQLEGYGLNADGQRRMVTCDMNCPIDESTILWIGIEPEKDGKAVPNNYVVAGVPERSLNQIAYTIQEVNVS
jgi:hypothetical protein